MVVKRQHEVRREHIHTNNRACEIYYTAQPCLPQVSISLQAQGQYIRNVQGDIVYLMKEKKYELLMSVASTPHTAEKPCHTEGHVQTSRHATKSSNWEAAQPRMKSHGHTKHWRNTATQPVGFHAKVPEFELHTMCPEGNAKTSWKWILLSITALAAPPAMRLVAQ